MQLHGRLLWSIPDAGGVLGGIGRTKVYGLIKEGELEKVNIGSRGFVTSESLDAYLERLKGSVVQEGAEHAEDLPMSDVDGEVL